MAGKGVDGIGLAAVAFGSALMFAGIKGYSFLAVLENLVAGKPINTGTQITNRLTIDAAVVPQTPAPSQRQQVNP